MAASPGSGFDAKLGVWLGNWIEGNLTMAGLLPKDLDLLGFSFSSLQSSLRNALEKIKQDWFSLVLKNAHGGLFLLQFTNGSGARTKLMIDEDGRSKEASQDDRKKMTEIGACKMIELVLLLLT